MVYSTQESIDEALSFYAQENDTKTIKYLLTQHPVIQASIDTIEGGALTWACVHGNLPLVQYLLTSPELKIRANIHNNNDEALLLACYHEHLDIVRYLLTSPELKEHANINADDDNIVVEVCRTDNIEVLQYILTSPEISKHANMNNKKRQNEAILEIVYHNHQKGFEYLLLDYQLHIEQSVKDIIIEKKRIAMLELLLKIELEKKLHQQLPINNTINRIKI